jgi:hypothetical protein
MKQLIFFKCTHQDFATTCNCIIINYVIVKYVTSPFLFSKSTIEAQHPPSPSVHSGSGNKYGTDLSVGRKWEHIFPFFKIIIKIH